MQKLAQSKPAQLASLNIQTSIPPQRFVYLSTACLKIPLARVGATQVTQVQTSSQAGGGKL